jgi:hypothetical protein
MDSFEDSVDGGSTGVKVLQNNGPWGLSYLQLSCVCGHFFRSPTPVDTFSWTLFSEGTLKNTGETHILDFDGTQEVSTEKGTLPRFFAFLPSVDRVENVPSQKVSRRKSFDTKHLHKKKGLGQCGQ